MNKSFTFQALTLLVVTVVCLVSWALPPSATADGTGGDPPPPNPPIDSTITVPVAPVQLGDTQTASEELSLWEEILSLFTLEA